MESGEGGLGRWLLWPTRRRHLEAHPHSTAVEHVAGSSAAHTLLASASGGTVLLWDALESAGRRFLACAERVLLGFAIFTTV